MYHLAIFAPFVGFLIAGLLGRVIKDRGSQFVTCTLMGLSTVFCWFIFLEVVLEHKETSLILFKWIEVGALHSYKDENKYMGWYGQSYNSGSNHPRTGSNENFIWAAGHLILVAGGDNSFSIQSGTSFAGPYVAAAAALMWERNPSLSYKEIRDGLLSCPIYEIPMNTIQKSGVQTVSFEQNKVQRPVLDIHHLLGLN